MQVIYAFAVVCALLVIFDLFLVLYLKCIEDKPKLPSSIASGKAVEIARKAIIAEQKAKQKANSQAAAAQKAEQKALIFASALAAAQEVLAQQLAVAQITANNAAAAALTQQTAEKLLADQIAQEAAAAQVAAVQQAAVLATADANAYAVLAQQQHEAQLAADQAATEAEYAATRERLLAEEEAKKAAADLVAAEQATIDALSAEQIAQAVALADQIAAEQSAVLAQGLRTQKLAGAQFMHYPSSGCHGRNELGIKYVPNLETCARNCIDDGCSSFDFEQRAAASNLTSPDTSGSRDSVCYLSKSCTPELATSKSPNFSLYVKS